jgi:DNA-binding XRE family transcriptional regulator
MYKIIAERGNVMPLSKASYTEDEKLFLRNMGYNIQCLRKKRDLSQEELAEIVDVSLSTINHLESSVPYGISLVLLRRITKALKAKPSDILDDI